MKKRIIYFIILTVFILTAGFLFWRNLNTWQNVNELEENIVNLPEQTLWREVFLSINSGDTIGKLLEQADISSKDIQAILKVSEPVYDLKTIRAGRKIVLHYEKSTNKLTDLIYQIDTESELWVSLKENILTEKNIASSTEEIIKNWQAEIKEINYEVKIKINSGIIETSVYEAALKNNIDERAIIDMADAFQWTIDFAMDPRVNDTFKLIYEERYLKGEYIMPGQILAAEYVNEGQKHRIFYFEESDENKGYFDEEGNSVQKMFLKAPIQYKYISSGFTTGLRCLEAFSLCTNHRAIDYAAAIGTPIRSVGDGTVVSTGWSSVGYGNLTSIRHNGTYTTNYAHQSKIIVRRGQKVKQGEIIGYVGSTGLSTGPHLHYEMVKNGTKINPLKEVLPPGTAIKEENKIRFFEEIKKYQQELD